MNSFSDSLDESRGETKYLEELKQKDKIIKENACTIASLRGQVDDFKCEIEELEKSEEVLRRDICKYKKELSEKIQELEAVSHALKEVETANENLNKRYSARTGQIQKYAEDLVQSKRQIEELTELNEQLSARNEYLTAQLSGKELALKRHKRDEQDPTSEELLELKKQLVLIKSQLSNETDRFKSKEINYVEQIEVLRSSINSIQQQNERLSAELKNLKRNSNQNHSNDQTDEEVIQELYDLRAKVKSLQHRESRRSIDEEILKLKQELDVTETSWKLERQHKERYARENCLLEKKVAELSKQLREFQDTKVDLESRLNALSIPSPPPALPPKDDVKKPAINSVADENRREVTSAYRFPTVDEPSEFMDASSVIVKARLEENSMRQQENQYIPRKTSEAQGGNLCANHQMQKSRLLFNDPIDVEKMRLERINELARRNKLTKPLHQTSYALELETFDDTTRELDIKRGNINRRRVLADSSNQTKPVFKKAEAFVV